MDNADEKKPDTRITSGMHKSAIIYRDDSASFIYVCFHCGSMFNEINETLQHIECHFQLASVVVDPFTDVGKQENFTDSFPLSSGPETSDIKTEIFDNEINSSSAAIRSELVIEDDVREYCCKVCNAIQSSKFLFYIHVLNVHIREPMKCCYCTNNRPFENTGVFENHLRRHIAKGEVNWESVTQGIHTSMEFDWSAYESAASIDLKLENEVTVQKAKRIPSSNELVTVKRRRHKSTTKRVYSRPYRCHKCSQTCRYMNALKDHLKTHTDDELLETYKCKECDCYFKNSCALRIHVLGVHFGTKRLSCNACDLEFNFAEGKQFEEHLQLHNGPDNKLWTDVRYGIQHQKDDFSKYEEFDSFTEQQFSCEFCTQRFYLKSNLDVHMKSVHSGQRRLRCGQCDSIFTTPKVCFQASVLNYFFYVFY